MCLQQTCMAKLLKSGAIALGSLLLTTGLGALLAAPASAQAAYGSYVGIGGSFGLTEGDDVADEGRSSGGLVAVRYRLLEVPISLRAQVLISERTTIVPTVSYDFPLNWQMDGYVGAGVSFPLGGDGNDTSPIGNQTSFVLQPGIDYSLPNSNVVLFGNAIIAFDAYRESGGTAASLQGGVGLRF